MGVENPFLQSSASRFGKREKGQEPQDLSSGGLDTVTDEAASCGGQRNGGRFLLDRMDAVGCGWEQSSL